MFGRRAKAVVLVAALLVLAVEGVLLIRYYDRYYGSDGASGAPSGSTPPFESTTPEGAMPEGAMPEGAMPEGTALEKTIATGTSPRRKVPPPSSTAPPRRTAAATTPT